MNRYQMGVIDVTIEELKGEVIADVKDYVTDTAKTAFLTWVATRILPAVREMAEADVGAVKASAGAESGWCKIRDIIVIPALVSAGIWLAEQIVDKTAKI